MISRHEKVGNRLATLHILWLAVPFNSLLWIIEQAIKLTRFNGYWFKNDFSLHLGHTYSTSQSTYPDI